MPRPNDKIRIFTADDLWPKKEPEYIDIKTVLDRLLDNLSDIAQFSEFTLSVPEIVITVAPQVWTEFERAQEHGYLEATDDGVVPGTEYRFLKFVLAKTGARLIIQEGPQTSALEIIQ